MFKAPINWIKRLCPSVTQVSKWWTDEEHMIGQWFPVWGHHSWARAEALGTPAGGEAWTVGAAVASPGWRGASTEVLELAEHVL
jgi:hypothetical protein